MAMQAGEAGPLVVVGSGELLVVALTLVGVVVLAAAGAVLLTRRRRRPQDDLQRDLREQRQDIERREHRIAEREQRLDHESVELEARAVQVADAEEERRVALELVAGLSADEARARLLESLESDAKRAAAISARAFERAAEDEAEVRARRILATAIQRLASEQTSESVVSLVSLPSDDMKGRIIGREGRNIRAFEQVTGVNLVIDDTPEAVLLSCFDPIRREVARVTLEELILDGRIHPSRVEEVHQRSAVEVEQLVGRRGR